MSTGPAAAENDTTPGAAMGGAARPVHPDDGSGSEARRSLAGPTSSNRESDVRIAETAAVQHGVITRAQLIDVGLSPSAVGRRLRSGRLVRIHGGVYRVGPMPMPRAAEAAAVLACGPDALISHGSALTMLGLRRGASGYSRSTSVDPTGRGPTGRGSRAGSTVNEPTGRAPTGRGPTVRGPTVRGPTGPAAPVDVTVVGSHRGRRAGIRMHRVREMAGEDRSDRGGIPVTCAGRTLVDVASFMGTSDLEWAIARAEREGLVEREDLVARLDRCSGRPGSRALRMVLGHPAEPAMTRSEAEAVFLRLIRNAALPSPEANVPMGAYEVDFYWRGVELAVEVDGFEHHRRRPRFEGDRRKEMWLASRGITVVRTSWRQVTEESLPTAVMLGQALALAEARRRTDDARG